VTELTARRKADRAEMARQVADLAREYGLSARYLSEMSGSRSASVDLGSVTYGLRVAVRFNGGAASPDIYTLNWYGVRDGWRLHPGMFGNVNLHHGHKATDVACGFAQLLRILRERFAVIRDGSAFTTSGGYDAGDPVHVAGEAAFIEEHTADLDEDPDRCSCGGLMCGGCGAHYPSACQGAGR
jgi:hypothetical protein